jgi:glucose/arabinose dehydrogenase
MSRHAFGVVLGLAAALLPAVAAAELESLRLAAGFRAELYAEVPGARSLAVVPALNAAFVGSRDDVVSVIVDADGDGRADGVEPVLSGLRSPNGIAWRDGALYVAEQHRIVRYAAPDLATLKAARPEVIFAQLPDKAHHGWRYAKFGPDGLLYVAVGAPCNVCAVRGLEGTIIRLPPQPGAAAEVFASGVRNSVGFDWEPRTGVFHFTDNGSDWLGDDLPPDELNAAPEPGLFFGFPYYGGGAARTREFLGQEPPRAVAMPVVAFGAHVAALGLHFYRGPMFPADARGDAFVAQHGSWNRSVPDGYRVVRVRFDARGRPTGYEPFVDGFLTGRRPWGRPVDVAELPDGSLLVSDDHGDRVLRITYTGG